MRRPQRPSASAPPAAVPARSLTRLASGHATDTTDLRDAQEHADEARERAEASFQRAVAGHERAARSHDRTAEVHEEAARRGLGDRGEHHRRAERHRHDALADRGEAERDRVLAAQRWPHYDGAVAEHATVEGAAAEDAAGQS